MTGSLFLVPTPIDDERILHQQTKELLLSQVDKAIFCVEEHKEGRRRWLRFGLPRDLIDKFIIYNEHTRSDVAQEILKKLKNGHDVFLMSDCGLPAFCDPGANLVNLCHDAKIKVTSTYFANSIALAVALSGFSHERFIFEGFIPQKNEQRKSFWKRISKQNEMSILMDTPYRMKKVLEEVDEIAPHRDFCLCVDLQKKSEIILRKSNTKNILAQLEKMNESLKREFILVIDKKDTMRSKT